MLTVPLVLVHTVMTHFEWPKTVKEWRDGGWKPDGSRPYDLGKREPLRKFFQDHGYTLWISEYEQGFGDMCNVQLHPPNDEPRRPDGYTFVSRYQCQPGILIYKPEFSQAVCSKISVSQIGSFITQ